MGQIQLNVLRPLFEELIETKELRIFKMGDEELPAEGHRQHESVLRSTSVFAFLAYRAFSCFFAAATLKNGI